MSEEAKSGEEGEKLTCENCPYGLRARVGDVEAVADAAGDVIQCRRFPVFIVKRRDDACGEHPVWQAYIRHGQSQIAAQVLMAS